jgi:hypothetical protein
MNIIKSIKSGRGDMNVQGVAPFTTFILVVPLTTYIL